MLPSCSGVERKDVSVPRVVVTMDSSYDFPGIEKCRTAIQQFMDSCGRKTPFNGSFLVAKDGHIIYEQYGGYVDYKRRSIPITANSPFHLASVSKSITATAVLRLCEQGKIGLDSSASLYLTGFPRPEITVRTLLNHRSGLPNYVHYMERLGWSRKTKVTNQDVLAFLIKRHKEIGIAPNNRRFSYSNTNYALLALIIERVTGKNFGDYLRDSIFIPLDMKNSFVFSRSDSAKVMPSYFYSGKQYAFDYLDLVYGDKNIFSTVQDLNKFEHALSEKNILGESSLVEAYSPYSNETRGIRNYGLGWRMYVLKNGKKLIYHNGWWHGNRTAFLRLLDEKVTIIALCNNDSKQVYSIKKLADLFGRYLQKGSNDDDDEAKPTVSSTE